MPVEDSQYPWTSLGGQVSGSLLSGGERQRIAIARAFLRAAPILILDEPTSSLDMKAEQVVLDALQKITHGRTTFIISHRPSTLQHCDLRLHLEHGILTAPSNDDGVEVEACVQLLKSSMQGD